MCEVGCDMCWSCDLSKAIQVLNRDSLVAPTCCQKSYSNLIVKVILVLDSGIYAY